MTLPLRSPDPHRLTPIALRVMGTIALLAALPCLALAQVNPPSDATVMIAEDFESSRSAWAVTPGAVAELRESSGLTGSTGLVVHVSAGKSRVEFEPDRQFPDADEAYLSFWLDPTRVQWSSAPQEDPALDSIQVATVVGPNHSPLISLRIRRLPSGQFEGFLHWRGPDGGVYDYPSGRFSLGTGWQHVALGFHVDQWAAAWVNGRRVRAIESIEHFENSAVRFGIGKTAPSPDFEPRGELHFDKIEYKIPAQPDLWVDAILGSDSNSGRTRETAFRTISRASWSAQPGTLIHILPGIYREAIATPLSGRSGEPIVFRAEEGLGTVSIRGSVRSDWLDWTRLEENVIGLPEHIDPSEVWFTDLARVGFATEPRFVVRLDEENRIHPLTKAREPDWRVGDVFRRTRGWWRAEGGHRQSSCNPSQQPDCDRWTRSSKQLTEVSGGVDAMGLLGDLTGATAIMLDREINHYYYRRQIVEHDVATGRFAVDEECNRNGANEPGLGWGTRFYVENHPALLDTPGEWFYDAERQRLYLWPPERTSPAEQRLEISLRDNAIDLTGRSWVHLRGLTIELFNGSIYQVNNWIHHRSAGLEIVNSRLRWADKGVTLSQEVHSEERADRSLEGFRLLDSELAHLDTHAITLTQRWDEGSDADAFTRSGMFDTVIARNEIHDVGFNAELVGASSGAISFRHPDRLRFSENHVHDIAGEGILLLESVAEDHYRYLHLSEIGIGEIEVSGNIVERACLIKGDCGGIRLWGVPERKHVFRDLWIVGNTIRDVLGWSAAAQERGGGFAHGRNPGAVGYGLYADNSTGFVAYRNLIHDNGRSGIYLVKSWRDGSVVLANNTLVDNRDGIRFGSASNDTPTIEADVINNIFVDNEAFGIVLRDRDGQTSGIRIDGNLYYGNGWGAPTLPSTGNLMLDLWSAPTRYYPSLRSIRAGTRFERNGLEAAPRFRSYRRSDQLEGFEDAFDFRLEPGSDAINRGVDLPPFAIDSLRRGGLELLPLDGSWDIGAFEQSAELPE